MRARQVVTGTVVAGQRHAPGQPGTTRLRHDGEGAVAGRRPLFQVGQAAAGHSLRDADSVIDHLDDRVVTRFGGDRDGAGVGVADRVADRFPDHRFGMLGDGRRHQRVDSLPRTWTRTCVPASRCRTVTSPGGWDLRPSTKPVCAACLAAWDNADLLPRPPLVSCRCARVDL